MCSNDFLIMRYVNNKIDILIEFGRINLLKNKFIEIQLTGLFL
jgi:hypothetical protein